MALPADYISGTITLTNGSPNFTGTGTGWQAADFREGDILLGVEDHAGQVYVIATITSQTSGTLTQDWAGTSGTYTYRMRYEWDSSRVSAQARNLIELLGNGNIQAIAGLDGTGGDKGILLTGAGTAAEFPLTAFARTLLDDANAAAMRGTLQAQENLERVGFVELAKLLSGDRSAFIDMHASDGGLDYSARIIRRPGVNGVLEIAQTGTGLFELSGGGELTRNGRAIYHRANILGTVGQSGGIPNGAIIERGSNANGQYVRYADGTQICWISQNASGSFSAIGSIFKTPSTVWNFPVAFPAPPSCSLSVVTGASLTWGGLGDGGVTNTSVTWAGYRAELSLSVPQAGLIAIGRWF